MSLPSSRRILLTGASSGIGRELARQLAREGHRLALLARRGELLREVAAQVAGDRAGPGPVHAPVALPADVRDAEAVSAAVAAAEHSLGPLDTLIYSAGAARFLAVEETTDAVWAEMLAANLTGLFHCVRACLPNFRARGCGHVVAILSVASRQAFRGSSAYTAAKFGALGFIESLRDEVRRSGIHVTAVLPGATDTPIWDGLGPGWDRSKMMRPEQVARVVASSLRDTSSGMLEEIRLGPVGGNL